MNAEDFTDERMSQVSVAATELVSYVKAWFEWQLVKTRIESMQHVYDINDKQPSPRRAKHFKAETYSSRKRVSENLMAQPKAESPTRVIR